MERYIDKGVQDFIKLVEEESTNSLSSISGANPKTILNLFNKNQLITTIDEMNTERKIERYTAYALLKSGKLLRFSYGYAPNGLLDIWVSIRDDGDKFVLRRYETCTQKVQIIDEHGEIFNEEKPIVVYDHLNGNQPLKDLISPVSVEQLKNRGIIALDPAETNPVIYKLIEYINSNDHERKGCVHMDLISMQESHIDDLFNDDQLVSFDSDKGNIRWAIMDYSRILKITCLPLNNGYSYAFELSIGIHIPLAYDSSLYYVDEVLDRSTEEIYFYVRRLHEEKNYGNGTILSSKSIGSVIKTTDINQLIERSKDQFKK